MSSLLKNQATYSLETLSNEYNQSPLQPKRTELVTDDEVSAHIKKYEWFYAAWFYLIITFALSYLVTH